jgi:hypothetical protein
MIATSNPSNIAILYIFCLLSTNFIIALNKNSKALIYSVHLHISRMNLVSQKNLNASWLLHNTYINTLNRFFYLLLKVGVYIYLSYKSKKKISFFDFFLRYQY